MSLPNSLFSLVDRIRSRIRYARYSKHNANLIASCGYQRHPVTLGPEQISRYFAYTANREHRNHI